jgi:hypothetical protein
VLDDDPTMQKTDELFAFAFVVVGALYKQITPAHQTIHLTCFYIAVILIILTLKIYSIHFVHGHTTYNYSISRCTRQSHSKPTATHNC